MDFNYDQDGLNPLIEQFLKELKLAANRKASKMEFVYGQALKSLRQHDQPVHTLAECRKIKYFGEKTCKVLQEKLESYSAKHGLVLGLINNQPAVQPQEEEEEEEERGDDDGVDDQQQQQGQPNKQKKKKTQRQYVPKFKSVGFSVMISLIKSQLEGGDGVMAKTDLIRKCELYCEDVKSISIKFGSSVKTLLEKELIIQQRQQRFSTFQLTDKGRQLADQMLRAMIGDEEYHKLISDSEEDQMEQEEEKEEEDGREGDDEEEQEGREQQNCQNRLVLEPGQFQIILIVDSRERLDQLEQHLNKLDIRFEMRTLAAGDFAWIAKPIHDRSLPELMIDFVVERKKMADLAASIKDNRWNEQKYRLKRCGLSHPLYLIEGFHRNDDFYAAMRQAIADAQIIDGFSVKHTKDEEDTFQYLANQTRWLKRMFESKRLICCPKSERQSLQDSPSSYLCMSYNEYAQQSQKISNFTCREMFVKHLLQIHGITLEKAKSITDQYETLPCLLQAYRSLNSQRSREEMLSGILFGKQKSIGVQLSKQIYSFYGQIDSNG